MIPKQLQKEGINFVLLEKSGKKPFQKDWQKKEVSYDNPELKNHLNNDGNYGVRGGGKKNLIIIDFDNENTQKKVLKNLPKTFTVKTGSGLLHKYFFSDKSNSFKIFDEEMNTLADVQGEGKQVVGPGSTHPNGNKYEIVDESEIAEIPYSEIQANLIPLDKKPKKKKKEEQKEIKRDYDDSTLLDELKSSIKIEDVLMKLGIDTSKNPTECPFHSSKGGKCLGFQNETAHCFHCDGSWNIFSLVMQEKNCDFAKSLEYLCEWFSMQDKLEESRKRYLKNIKNKEIDEIKLVRYKYLELISGKEKQWAKATELLTDYILKKVKIYTTRDDLKSEMWIYEDGIYAPNGKSKVKEFLRKVLGEYYSIFVFNQVCAKIEPDTFVDAEKFFDIKYKWEIPVKNGILNIKTLELFPFSQKKIFFNKIPVRYDPNMTCPKIEKFLKDVLSNEEDIKVFYELAGFGLMKEYLWEKAFMFVGDGRNGKGKSIELLKRLVGVENCCSVPLSSLDSENFSVSELFGKFFNLAGDISNQDLKDTTMFKSLTGRDLVSGKRKFQKNIHFQNYAKFVFACNELPMVYDMTKGFWDRWILLDFPYTFVTQEEINNSEDKTNLKIRDPSIIEKISTDDEMSGFLNSALVGLHTLLLNKDFSSTKGSEEVKSTWIRKSNSFTAFCYDNIVESTNGKISKKLLRKKYSDYCKEHKISSKSDFVIKRVLGDTYGVVDERLNEFGDMWEWYWVGIKFKRDSRDEE